MKFLFQLTEEEFNDLLSRRIKNELAEFGKKVLAEQEKGYEKLLKIDEVTTMLGVTRKTIFNWIKQRKITSHHIGGRLFFKKVDIEKCLQTNFKK